MSGGRSQRSRFEDWVRVARKEPLRSGDVAAATLAAIRERRSERAAVKPMLVFAGMYGLLLVVGVVIAYRFGVDTDPMAGFFAMAREVAP